MREIKEEFGLEVKLIWHDTIKQLSEDEQSQPRVKIINRPIHILLEDLKDHQHIDLIYYAIAISDKVTLEEVENIEESTDSIDDITSTRKKT